MRAFSVLVRGATFFAISLMAGTAHAQTQTPTSRQSIIHAEESVIPQTVTRPESLGAAHAPEVTRCDRQFTWKNHTYECDSFHRRDAEGLREIIGDVPDALDLLNSYQRARRQVRVAAYAATGGLAVGGLAFLGSRFLFQPGDVNAQSFRNIGLGAGLGIIALSFITAAILQQTNEAKLDRLVETYNQARPDTPILLQFSTEFQLK